MQLSQPDSTTPQAHPCNTFQLTPSTFAIHPTQPDNIMNFATDSDSFNIRDFADDLKVHWRIESVVSLGFEEDTKRPN
jgi:hypothetical protein